MHKLARVRTCGVIDQLFHKNVLRPISHFVDGNLLSVSKRTLLTWECSISRGEVILKFKYAFFLGCLTPTPMLRWTTFYTKYRPRTEFFIFIIFIFYMCVNGLFSVVQRTTRARIFFMSNCVNNFLSSDVVENTIIYNSSEIV